MKQYLKTFVTKIEKETGLFEVIASTADVDRDGEVIDPKGWDITNYLKNPVILFAHDYSSLPIGIAERVSIGDDGLFISGKFASDDANPMAGRVRRLYEEGILKAVSVGFIPKLREGNTITKAELLELSFVPVPANPNALALAATKGLDLTGIELKEEFEPPKEPETKDFHRVVEGHFSELEREMNDEVRDVIREHQRDLIIDLERELEDWVELGVKQNETEVQTLILSKERFATEAEARAWVTEHDFHAEKVDETDDSWRFRQFEPSDCQENSFRTIELSEGVSAVICRPQEGKTCGGKKVKEIKAGRVLSEKNRNLIKAAIDQFSKSITVLTELLEATEPDKGGTDDKGDREVAGRNSANDEILLPREVVEEFRNWAKQKYQNNELILTLTKKVLAQPKDGPNQVK